MMMTSLTIIMTVVVYMVMISIMMITIRRVFFFLIFSCFINQPIAVTIRSTEF